MSTRKKRRVILMIVMLLAVAVLTVGAVFDFPFINVARKGGSWLVDKFSGASGEEITSPEYLFLTLPQTGTALSGDVSTLAVLYKDEGGDTSKRTILDMALLTYNTERSEGEVYLIPESVVAYNASGKQIKLALALREQGGRDLIRSTVNNLAGSDVDYLVLLELGEAMQVIQRLRPPRVLLEKDLALPNPLSGETDHLAKGLEIGDADRLLSYLVALDVKESRDARLDRASSYLPEAFYVLQGQELIELEEGLSFLDRGDMLEPGTGGAEEDRRYLASMVEAFAGLGEGGLVIRAIPKVEVVNGCGVPDLGKKVGDRLVSLGVVVSGTGGNAKINVNGEEVNDFSHQVSGIVYRSEDLRVEAYARYLGVLMSIGDVKYTPGPGPEIVLVGGKDLAK